MKKFFASFLAVLIAAFSLTLIATPAQAGVSTNITYCQADNGIKGFNQITADPKSIITKDGKLKQSGVNADDIIPPFDYNFGGNDYGTFEGWNWTTTENQTLWKNQCKPSHSVLTPVIPLDLQATCVNSTPALTIPEQPAGVTVSSVFVDGQYEVLFGLIPNTAHNTYGFPEGFVNPVIVNIIPAGPGDQYWDVEKGACNLPDTGAGGISSSALMFGGIALGLGLVATAFAPMIRKRNA